MYIIPWHIIFSEYSFLSPDPTLIVRIFLFQRAHIQYRDLFIFKHFAFTSKMSKNVLRFLWHGAYHVVVRGGSHFCQSPKSGGVRSFLIKTWGRANTFFWKKIPKFPSPPPQEKTYLPLFVKNEAFFQVINPVEDSSRLGNICMWRRSERKKRKCVENGRNDDIN